MLAISRTDERHKEKQELKRVPCRNIESSPIPLGRLRKRSYTKKKNKKNIRL